MDFRPLPAGRRGCRVVGEPGQAGGRQKPAGRCHVRHRRGPHHGGCVAAQHLRQAAAVRVQCAGVAAARRRPGRGAADRRPGAARSGQDERDRRRPRRRQHHVDRPTGHRLRADRQQSGRRAQAKPGHRSDHAGDDQGVGAVHRARCGADPHRWRGCRHLPGAARRGGPRAHDRQRADPRRHRLRRRRRGRPAQGGGRADPAQGHHQ